MDRKKIIFKIIFSFVFVGLVILKLVSEWFNTRIDMTIISLIIISFFPWISEYLKSIEAFGVKAEFISESKKEKIDKEANKVIKDNKDIMTSKNASIEITKNINNLPDVKMMDTLNNIEDPLEKMVLIRYEIEKILRDICSKNFDNGTYFKNIRSMTDVLCKKNIIVSGARNLILDLIPFLNKAVHADVTIKEYNNVKWVIEKGMLIIAYLNMVQDELKINKKS